MSDQVMALLLTLGFFALLALWVPLLDFLQRRLRSRRVKRREALQFFVERH